MLLAHLPTLYELASQCFIEIGNLVIVYKSWSREKSIQFEVKYYLMFTKCLSKVMQSTHNDDIGITPELSCVVICLLSTGEPERHCVQGILVHVAKQT